MDCGEMAQAFDVGKDHKDELDIPHAPKRSAMQLTWPPSVSYSAEAYLYGQDRSLCKALELYLEQLCCENRPGDSTAHSRPSKSIDLSWDQASSGIRPVYKPLRGTKIRILKLSRGRFENPIHGNLETIDLHHEEPKTEVSSILLVDNDRNHTPYEAVSYTWATISGDRRKDHVIFIDKSWNMLPITENCFDALRNCRLEDKDRYLWIDSICINQSDVSERTHQVGLMRDIYSAANRVLIYLSVDHTGGDSEAIQDDPEILCLNPYFSRIWVVQEIGSAKKAMVLYKRQSMGWEFFHTNLQRLMTRKWIRHFGRPRQIDDADSFLALLEDTWDCHATDPRDKVFALLGLWKASLEPDYTLSPQAVYTGLASSLVTNEDLKLAGRVLDMASQGHSMTGLPSWVPDLSVKSQQLYRRVWTKTSFLPTVVMSGGLSKRQKFRVHRGTGSLCAVAAEIDVLAPYLHNGFRVTTDGTSTAAVGQIRVSLPLHVISRCKPTDRIFEVHEYDFFLILRKKTDTRIYTFIGLCDYQVLATPTTTQVDAIRYLNDWAWLLDGQKTWKWSKLINWEETHKCWLALKEQRRLERRICLQRMIHKACFLKRVHELVEVARHALNNCNREGNGLLAFFSRRWTIICRQWRVADDLQTSVQQEHRSKIRNILRGYKSLEPSPESLGTTLLEPSMWLPVSSHWFRWIERYEKDQLYTYYPPLAACIANQIPLPPLTLVDTPENRMSLFLEADLETGLRQLQLVAHNYPLSTPEKTRKGRSYSLNTPHDYGFNIDYLDAFLRWVSKPWSPSVSVLRSDSNMNSLLIWEDRFKERHQISVAHRQLDKNFDKHLALLSTSSGGEILFSQFFNLIYREQFELLWLFVIEEYGAGQFPLLNIEFARAFWWRFHRSIDKVYRILGENMPTDDQTEQKWDRFLDWLAQGKSQPRATDLPLVELEFRPRPGYDEESRSVWLWDFFTKLNNRGSFISTGLPGTLYRPEKTDTDPLSRPEICFSKERLLEIVHSEIQRRRLPEKVFAFLFNDTRTDREPPVMKCTIFDAMVSVEQLPVLDINILEGWRQEEEQWKTVEAYVSDSEWHMTSLKLKLLGGIGVSEKEKNDCDVYKEIVIV
jgi:hypothetical protein